MTAHFLPLLHSFWLKPPEFFNSSSLSLSPGEDNGTPLLYSCLENPMDGGVRKGRLLKPGVEPLSNLESVPWKEAL